MKTRWNIGGLAAWRWLLAAAALLIASCGGGGGGEAAPPEAERIGQWHLALSFSGGSASAGTVPGSSVPTQAALGSVGTSTIGQEFATAAFQGFTVTVNGATVTVVGPDTNYALTITGLTTSNYQGCGACGVSSQVSFQVKMAYTQTGTFQGSTVTPGPQSLDIGFTFQRLS